MARPPIIYHVFQDNENLVNFLQRFDLGHEPSLPNFFSSLLNLFAAILAFLTARQATKAKLSWYFVGIVLVFMALDETIMFHEMFNSALQLIGIESGEYYFAWTLVGLAFAIFVFIFALPILIHSSKHTAIMIMVSGFVYVSGALGVENIAANIMYEAGSEEEGVKKIAHWICQTIEESLEMAGMAIFIDTLLGNLRRKGFDVRLVSDNA